ncbi:MAG: keto-deoxy-phosphogluconate aldolase, partial [Beijerinckiaceae bacterium]
MRSTSETAQALLQPAQLIPLLHIENLQDAVPLARTFVEAGLPVIEVGLRTHAAQDAIGKIAAEVPGAIPIAGNVMTAHDLSIARRAGAKLATSP